MKEQSYTSTPPMGRTAGTEPQCLYKGALYYFNIFFYVYGSVHRNNIRVYNSNQMLRSQSLFNLIIAPHVSGITITHLQEHKTTASTASGNRYTVLLSVAIAADNSTV